LILVAIIAVVVLAGGGWFVMKTRAENAEKARVAAEQKAEAERQALATKEQAERDRLAKEAAVTAERERQEKLYTTLRSRVAELNVAYDALMRSETAAERELSELKSQERDLTRELKGSATPESRRLSAQLRAQDRYVAWLRETLPVHPAKVAKARLEELISARAVDDAIQAAEAYVAALDQLKADLAAARHRTAVTGTVELTANLPGTKIEVIDAFGIQHLETAPALFPGVAAGPADVIFTAPGYPAQKQRLSVAAGDTVKAEARFRPARVEFAFDPTEATAEPVGVIGAVTIEVGRVFEFPPGQVSFRVSAPGHAPRRLNLQVVEGETLRHRMTLPRGTLAVLKADVMEGIVNAPDATLASLAEGFDGGYGSYLGAFVQMFIHTDDREGYAALVGHLRQREKKIGLSTTGLATVLGGYIPVYGTTSNLLRPQPAYPAWLQQEQQRDAVVGPVAARGKVVREAADLLAAGKDPTGAGLSSAELDREANLIAQRLLELKQPALAEPWLDRWHANRPKADEPGGIVGMMLAFKIMEGWIQQGDVPRAIAVFNRHRQFNLSFDKTGYGFAPNYFTQLIAAAGGRGDQAAVERLTAFVAELQALPPPPADDMSRGNWFWMWENTLRRAGRGDAAHEARMLAEMRPGASPAARNPGSQAGLAGGAFGALASSTVQNNRLGIYAQLAIARSLAKRRAARGETEAAFHAAALPSSSAQTTCVELAFTFAACGDLPAALNAISRAGQAPYMPYADSLDAETRRKLAQSDRVYQRMAALIFGEGLAERADEARALKAIATTADPLLQLLAKAAYATRRHELEQLTPAQRDYIRMLPPL
jgi:hypothetical protein